ncbi:MAG: FAD-dependent oxidoreductase, partial [Kiloniellales bacterium]|nr:FAD-dependent oxidoreductase [Kiloniellales bacterium]
DACHAHDTVMIQQLYHVGQHGDAANSFEPNWSPSGLPSYHDADGSHAMTEAEIEEVIEAFAQAARRAKDAGFDGVELFAAYHALIDQFWTPWSNRRDDRWGGSFDKRMRFSSEIVRRIRALAGEDFVIGLAVNVDPDIEVSLSLEAMQEIVAYHDERGLMDYVTCGTGSYFDFYKLMPTSLYDAMLGPPFAAALKEVVKHAKVQAESHIRTPANAERVIAEGQADMASLVRAQIADPHLARKAFEGRPEDIRPCISCNQMCWGRRHRDYWISCLVNPSAGREAEWGGDRFTPAATPRHVLVVGGGPAGLEAARVAAERGHRVTLAERGEGLGGQWRLAGQQPSRGQILEHLAWYETQLTKLQVEVRLSSDLDAAAITEFGADAVVLATGGRPSWSGFQRALPAQDILPGADLESVYGLHEILDGSHPGRRVLLLDDLNDWRGTGTALFLAERGHEVAVVTAAPVLAKGLEDSAVDQPLRKRFARAGGEAVTSSALLSWSGETARLRSLLDGREWERAFDSLVLATLPEPENELQAALADSGLELHAIGDCVAPRRAVLAIYEGRKLGMAL